MSNPLLRFPTARPLWPPESRDQRHGRRRQQDPHAHGSAAGQAQPDNSAGGVSVFSQELLILTLSICPSVRLSVRLGWAERPFILLSRVDVPLCPGSSSSLLLA